MKRLQSWARWLFTGLRLFLPLIPSLLWIALQEMTNSTVKYWKDSQLVVDGIANDYMDKAPQEVMTEYDPYGYWICYSIASFLYLLGWLAMAWLTVEAFRMLISLIF